MADDEQQVLLKELAEEVDSCLEELNWIRESGAKDEQDVRRIMRSRKQLDKAIHAYANFSDEIEGLDFDDDANNVWFVKWRELKRSISEIQARMEATISMVATKDEEDAFAPSDEEAAENQDEDAPNKEGIAASLAMKKEIEKTMDDDIQRLADILRVTEDLKELADICLEDLQNQRERLMAINAKLKAIDKQIEGGEGIMVRIRQNMAANRCCWAIGCTIIWLSVALIVTVTLICTQTDLCGADNSVAVETGRRHLRGGVKLLEYSEMLELLQ